MSPFADKRRADRRDVAFQATARFDGKEIDCNIVDISTGGAKINARAKTERGIELTLVLGQMGELDAEVAWTRDRQIGIRFTDDPERVANAVIALASFGAG